MRENRAVYTTYQSRTVDRLEKRRVIARRSLVTFPLNEPSAETRSTNN